MAAPVNSILNPDALNGVFCLLDLKQLCIVEQVCKLWEEAAKNHSNWTNFANKYRILVGEKPIKNDFILAVRERTSYCTHALKVLNFQEPCMLVIQFQKKIGPQSPPSSIMALEVFSQIERTFPSETAQTLLMRALSSENCRKVNDSNELIADIKFWLCLGAVIDQKSM